MVNNNSSAVAVLTIQFPFRCVAYLLKFCLFLVNSVSVSHFASLYAFFALSLSHSHAWLLESSRLFVNAFTVANNMALKKLIIAFILQLIVSLNLKRIIFLNLCFVAFYLVI